MSVDIEKGAQEARIAEVNETFKYAETIASHTVATKNVANMTFTLRFEDGYVPTVSYDITEVCG